MRLKRTQKAKALEWVAEGLSTDEINERASKYRNPFSVSKQQVDYYRKTRKVDLAALAAVDELAALTTGLALKDVRVYRLQKLAALMEKDLFGGFLWTDEVKGVGSGTAAEVVEYEEFNAGEVAQYRGVLEDIAKEMGARAPRQEITGKDGGKIEIEVIRVRRNQDDD